MCLFLDFVDIEQLRGRIGHQSRNNAKMNQTKTSIMEKSENWLKVPLGKCNNPLLHYTRHLRAITKCESRIKSKEQ